MKLSIIRIQIASIIVFVLCATPIAAGQKRTCYSTNKVCINSANTENTELVSNAIKRAYDFFFNFGYSDRFFLEIIFQKEVRVENSDGGFIRVCGKLGKDNYIYLTDWNETWLAEQNAYGLKMSKEFYESLIVHEVAHFIAEKIVGRKIDNTDSEYIAYVVQLSQMHPKMRLSILSQRSLSAFKTEDINLEVMLFDPAVFAAKSYLHFKENKGQYLKEILSGAPHQFTSVAYWDFH